MKAVWGRRRGGGGGGARRRPGSPSLCLFAQLSRPSWQGESQAGTPPPPPLGEGNLVTLALGTLLLSPSSPASLSPTNCAPVPSPPSHLPRPRSGFPDRSKQREVAKELFSDGSSTAGLRRWSHNSLHSRKVIAWHTLLWANFMTCKLYLKKVVKSS